MEDGGASGPSDSVEDRLQKLCEAVQAPFLDFLHVVLPEEMKMQAYFTVQYISVVGGSSRWCGSLTLR